MCRVVALLALLSGLATSSGAAPPAEDPGPFVGDRESSETIVARGNYANSLRRFEQDRVGHVAFLGGSITEMNGYRPLLAAWLQGRFPETKFTFTNAGIASTCSTTGAFRLERDVLAPRRGVPQGGVDLLFVEFAVNDDQDAGHARREAGRGMEGVLRHVRRDFPRADVVVTHFVNPEMLATIRAGDVPVSIAAHEAVAEHYRVGSVNVAREVAERIERETLTWEQYGGTHPKPAGNRIAADLGINLVEFMWEREGREPEPHPLPEPLDDHSYHAGTLLPPDRITGTSGWTVGEPSWTTIPGSLRERFAGRSFASVEEPGHVARLSFTGRGVGAYVLAGPDAGMAEVRVDGGDWRAVDLYHRFSKGLHYPRTVMFADDFEPGEHEIEIRSSSKHNTASSGHAIRVVGWAVNGNE